MCFFYCEGNYEWAIRLSVASRWCVYERLVADEERLPRLPVARLRAIRFDSNDFAR